MLVSRLLVTVIALIVLTVSFGQLPVVCEDVSVGTSVLEILRATLSKNLVDSTLETLKLSPSLLDFHLPILTWMSDIVYAIEFPSSDPSSYKEIYIVQENYSKFNLFCHYFQSISWMNYFCTCSSDQKLQSKTWRDRILPQFQERDASNYCVRKAYCYRSDPSSGSCSVSVDPFRRSCIFINNEKFIYGKLEDSTSYSVQYPRLSQILPSKQSAVIEETDVIGDLINFLLNLIPYYPFLFILGFLIIVNAEEIAETVICQKAFEGILGITFALVILYFVAQSVLGRVLNRYNDSFLRFAQFPFVFSIISFVWYNPSSLAIIRDLLFQFWNKGAFGLPYLGKVYFIGCVLISWSISTYFGWFSNESKLWPIILYGVRFIGLILLSQSASNRELSMVFVFIGCFIPYIMEWLYYFQYSYIVIESFRQRRKNVKKVTETELQRATRIKTQNELAKLRNLLRNNPQLVQKTNDRFFEGEKTRQIDLLNRFVSGNYSGRPGQYNQDGDDDIDEDLKETPGFIKYFVYASLVILVLVIVKFYKSYFQNFSPSAI